MQHSLTPSFAGIIENQQQEITLDDALDDIFTGFFVNSCMPSPKTLNKLRSKTSDDK